MRGFIVAMVAALALAIPAQLSGQTPSQSRITITSTLEGVRVTPGGRVYQYLLWNTAITAQPLGHAFTACQLASGSAKICTSTFTLPHGRLIAISETHSLRRMFGVIVGGSRSRRAVRDGRAGYAGAEGTVWQRRVGPGTYALLFVLQL